MISFELVERSLRFLCLNKIENFSRKTFRKNFFKFLISKFLKLSSFSLQDRDQFSILTTSIRFCLEQNLLQDMILLDLTLFLQTTTFRIFPKFCRSLLFLSWYFAKILLLRVKTFPKKESCQDFWQDDRFDRFAFWTIQISWSSGQNDRFDRFDRFFKTF